MNRLSNRSHALSLSAAAIGAVAALLCHPGDAAAQNYRLERIVTGAQQPTYVTHAPGDHDHVYYVERTSAIAGDGNEAMGRIVKFNLLTKTKTTFVDFSVGDNPSTDVANDAGTLCLTFHPDFQTNGKFYTTSATGPAPVTNKLDEYMVVGGVPTFQRTILQYNNNAGTFHTIDWVGFKHAPPGDPARNHLYITTGDGGPQAPTIDRPQQPDNVYGKLLRVDISPGADAYPGDVNKNFGIPSVNTLASPPAGRLGEVIATGLRNPYRASFDRATNDLFIGDVGLDIQEEINFIKHETINPSSGSMTMFDFGWPTREGVADGPLPGTGVKGSSLDPIIFRTATTSDDGVADNSITGGYVYRGPAAELQGKYIFADYIAGRVYAINFDRNTDPATFNGTNYTNFQDLTTLWNSLIVDADGNPVSGPLARISSFGEDNDGNIYLVSLADNLASAYDSIGEGTIYKLVLIPEPSSLALLGLMGLLMRRRRE